jgi:hypothetical protein
MPNRVKLAALLMSGNMRNISHEALESVCRDALTWADTLIRLDEEDRAAEQSKKVSTLIETLVKKPND